MPPSLHARFTFEDETGSRAQTRIRLNLSSPRVETATLALANVLSQLSNAALVEVSILYRQSLSTEPATYPFRRRTRIAIPTQSDAYHAVLPVTLDGAYMVIDELYRQSFCAPSGDTFIPNAAIVQETEPNWREIAGVASGRYVLVLDEQLWRDLMLSSMSLDSASRRIRLDAPSGAQLRRQIVELLRGIPLEEILNRLDTIISILQQRTGTDSALLSEIDDVEELIEAILAAI